MAAEGRRRDLFGRGTVTIISNSTISGNLTGNPGTGGSGGTNGLGGGILSAGNLTISNSTVTANNAGTAGAGGGIRQSAGTITLKSTIVGGNTALVGPDIEGTVSSQGNNLIQNISGVTINETLDPGTNITGQSPLLNPLADNGGPTLTHALLPGSPAINAGDNCITEATHCGNSSIPQLTNDQRGFNRLFPVNGTVDIGAFESRA